MRVTITLEDTSRGLATEAVLIPNGISVDAQHSVAAMVAVAFSQHLVHLRKLGLLVVHARDDALEQGLLEAMPLAPGDANAPHRR